MPKSSSVVVDDNAESASHSRSSRDDQPLLVAAEAKPTYDSNSSLNAPHALESDLLAGSIDSDDERAALTEEEMECEVEAQVEAVSATTVGPIADATSKQLCQYLRSSGQAD